MQELENVALPPFFPSVFKDQQLGPARKDFLKRPDADKGIAADLFAALDRLQQKTLRLIRRQAQEGGDRRFQVRVEPQKQGHQRVFRRQMEEALAGRLGRRQGSERLGHGVVPW